MYIVIMGWKVTDSLSPDAKHRHITSLCHAILKKNGTGIKMTTYTQVRIAFIVCNLFHPIYLTDYSILAHSVQWFVSIPVPRTHRILLTRHFMSGNTRISPRRNSKSKCIWNGCTDKSNLWCRAMSINFQLDQEDFPSNMELVSMPVVLLKDLDEWQIICDRHAGLTEIEKAGRNASGWWDGDNCYKACKCLVGVY